MVSQELLVKAAESFGFKVETLVFVSNSCNEVYRFYKNNQSYILRLSEEPSAYVEKIKAVHTSLPIQASDQQFIAVYKEQEQCFIATAFHMASGQFFDKNNLQLWGPSIFNKWIRLFSTPICGLFVP
ncbi:hypothetical protein J7E73_27535 [Paenibacillus albidus]|uniref:hypothetical protein n=1 Tax=Paenibacillus albidus TaxID=2041023 RepID=UPI001BECA654|nr:hypothetical protein [Paenibacillus albidus]MBT2292815.1 hypothetical protein [Paenibacillus albidus]